MNKTVNAIYHSRWLIISIIAYGVAIRSISYFYNRSLWLDESMISVAMIELDWANILEPLKYGESAPIGFLVVSKLFIEFFGSSEYVLRLFPFLAGITSIYVFYKLTTFTSNASVRPIAIALFSTSTGLITYSNEVKQYSIDVLMCLILMTVAFLILRIKPREKRWMPVYGVILTICLWSSHASILVAAGVGLVLLIVFLWDRNSSGLYVIGILSGVGAVNIFLMYTFHFRHILNREFYFDWWDSYFAPFIWWGNTQDIRWYLNTFGNFVELIGVQQITLLGLVGVVMVTGIVVMTIRDSRALLLLLAPIVLLLVASWLRFYPMGNRLILFLIPYALIFLAEGICAMRTEKIRTGTLVPMILGVMMMSMPIVKSVAMVTRPPDPGIREVATIISEKVNNGDVLYIYYNAQPAFDYYFSELSKSKDINKIVGVSSRGEWGGYEQDLVRLQQFSSVWIFFSAVCCGEEEQFLNYLNSVGHIVYSITGDDVTAYLFSFP